ncbi:MAG: ribonuclease R [Firmicutes bacterium]|nr:ribonuclease R [Bacillota bacterium]
MDYKEQILELLGSKDYIPMSDEELVRFLQLEGKEIGTFIGQLDEMYEGGQVFKTKRDKYVLSGTLGIVTGTLQKHKKGFGFVIPADPEQAELGGDIFVSEENMHWAMNGDLVAVKLLKGQGAHKRREGAVARIIRHAHEELVGTFYARKGFGFLVPDDPRLTDDVFVSQNHWNEAQTGDKVVVKIIQWPNGELNAEGVVTEILAREGEPGGDIKALIRQYKKTREFPVDVQAEADSVETTLADRTTAEWEALGRRDLRDDMVITIDGADSKDFDDAVAVRRLPNGNWMLSVHIADVTHYVREGKPLDREAYNRGTSIYILNQVIPMLPERLSNGICSLNPGEDRLTLSVDMEIDKRGQIIGHEIYEAVIRSKERMVYTDVSDMLEDPEAPQWERYSHIKDLLLDMEELAGLLRKRREAHGSIDFDLDESYIKLDDEGRPVDIGIAERRVANKLIEDFMLAANETVAEHFYWMGVPFVYRVHDKPQADRITELKRFLGRFGLILKGSADSIHPKALNELLAQAEEMEEQHVINTVTLRAMQKAVYSPECLGHFGLGMKYYCHFTSPIRRYPDLMIHRIIKESLHGELTAERIDQLAVKVEEASTQSSVTERQAQEMEREADKMKMTEYMAGHIGEYFDGIISSVTNFGFFVQLENTVEGLVRAANLQDDYYQFQPEQYRLIGERYNKIYGLGDRVTIQVTRASVASREIDFALVDPDGGERQYSHRDRRGGERKGGKRHENQKIRGRKFRK